MYCVDKSVGEIELIYIPFIDERLKFLQKDSFYTYECGNESYCGKMMKFIN